MNLYQNAVWHELKNTMAEWDKLVDLSQNPKTSHLVPKDKLDKLRHKINGLLSQLDNGKAA